MYDKLCRRLRAMASTWGISLPREAADAIEELVRKEKFHAFLWNVINPNEMEQYLAMYRAEAVPMPVLTVQETPKEET